MIFQAAMPVGSITKQSEHVQRVRERFEHGWPGSLSNELQVMKPAFSTKAVRRNKSDADNGLLVFEPKFRPISVVEMTRLFETNGPVSLPEKLRTYATSTNESVISGSVSFDNEVLKEAEGTREEGRELSPERPPRRKEKCHKPKMSNGELSEKITELGPLPPGPAPQKPPRTFEHDIYMRRKNSDDVPLSPNTKLSLEERRKHRACLSKPPVKSAKPLVQKKSDSENEVGHVDEEREKNTSRDSSNLDASLKKLRRPADPPPPVPISSNVTTCVPDSSVISNQTGSDLLDCFGSSFRRVHQYECIDDSRPKVSKSCNFERLFCHASSGEEHIYSEPENSGIKMKISRQSSPVYAVPFSNDVHCRTVNDTDTSLHYMSNPVTNVYPSANETAKVDDPKITVAHELQNLVHKVFGEIQRESYCDGSPNNSDALKVPSSELQGCKNLLNSSDSDSDALDIQKALEETEKRKLYIKNISRKASDACRQEFKSPYRHLFECVLVIGLYYDVQSQSYKPVINSSYPPHAKYPPKIPSFCYPDAANWTSVSESSKQTYCLVLTDQNGKRRFGYCKRISPDSDSSAESVAYCLISPFRAHSFYSKVLNELTAKHKSSESCKKSFMQTLYSKSLPKPGGTISVFDSSLAPSKSMIKIKRSVDSRLEDTLVSQLIESLDFLTIVKLLGTVLQERRLIVCSKDIGKLTNCVHAIESLLYPFSWQHIFVPVLPADLLEFCSAPMPFIIGVLQPDYQKLIKFQDDYMFIVNIDDGTVLHSVGDEAEILPKKIHRCLGNALELVQKFTKNGEPARNLLVSEFFIRLFVETCGHYRKYIVTTNNNGVSEFKRLEFIKGVKSKSIQNFLDWFSETAMFTCFIDQRINEGESDSGLFDRRIYEQFSDMETGTQNLMKNAQKMLRKVKPFGEKWL